MKIKILLSIISLAYILFSNNVLANQYGINTISECRDSINRLTYDVSKLNRIVFSKNQKKIIMIYL